MLYPNLTLNAQEQQDLVNQCNKFKKALQRHAREKKQVMQRCYAYLKSKFYGDDLLPLPAAEGQNHDINSQRPQVFIPVTRENVKLLHSQLKLTLFPNDDGYFRVKAKTNDLLPESQALLEQYQQTIMQYQQMAFGAQQLGVMPPPPPEMPQLFTYVDFEEPLTNALEYIFKQQFVSEKCGEFLLDAIWSGNPVAYPCAKQKIVWQWQETQQEDGTPAMEAIGTPAQPELHLEVWNPLHFYIDPSAEDRSAAGWGYFCIKKRQDILDDPNILNAEAIREVRTKTYYDNQQNQENSFNLAEFNQIQYQFDDINENVKCDYFYLPYVRTTSGMEYRNLFLQVVEESILAKATPNMAADGQNPVVFCTWADDKGTPYGTGMVEDIKDLQRLINILFNYKIETMARIGNRFIVREGVDLTNFWGLAGGVAVSENPQLDMVAITGNYGEIDRITNEVGILKAEAQVMAGAQNLFQGASNIDFKKTATEIQTLQESAMSIVREAIEHIGTMGIKPILTKLAMIAAQIYNEPINVRVEDSVAGPQFMQVDLSLLLSGQYEIELVTMNPAQSKMAQSEALMRLLESTINNPEALTVFRPVFEKLGQLNGIKDIPDVLTEIEQRLQGLQNAMLAAQPPLPNEGASGESSDDGAVEGTQEESD